ncbi:hypothetical protein [Enterobacter asburiae]|uniref:hypothetical protein n=1 Tax=Enterobacter asburiae TaxID=61645 RepID=UPI003B2701E0
MSNKHHELLGVPKHANQHRLSRLTMEVHTDELRIMASAVESYTDELIAALEAAEERIAGQSGIIASARKFISEYVGFGDFGAAEFIKIIDRAAAGKGETS